jgi:hypothetical protein
MKVEGWLFLGCAMFFGGSDVVNWYTSHDPTGDHCARARLRMSVRELLGQLAGIGETILINPSIMWGSELRFGVATCIFRSSVSGQAATQYSWVSPPRTCFRRGGTRRG